MEDIIIVVILLGIIGSIAWYLHRAKKRGETCIGCPYSKQCGSKCSGGCGSCGGCGGSGSKTDCQHHKE
ncbi:MAG TPA: FeoB-associated Cys-rich membrane protein [Candidatus Faecousia intestinigallinarum]|nr:FeoB-associated Cys-rich membrane protein [Candidatus Faecousia intestinigallinarum]